MSQETLFHIPKYILDLPIVSEGESQNRWGKLIDIKGSELGTKDPFSPYKLVYIPNQTEGLPAANVAQFSRPQIEAIYMENICNADAHYQLALGYREQRDRRYLVAGGLSYFAYQFAKTAYSLATVQSCSKPASETTSATISAPVAQAHCQDGVQDYAPFVGTGAALLGVAAILTFKSARIKAALVTLDFVKAALALGNAKCCDEELSKPTQTYSPTNALASSTGSHFG